jgi:hypothetical protein
MGHLSSRCDPWIMRSRVSHGLASVAITRRRFATGKHIARTSPRRRLCRKDPRPLFPPPVPFSRPRRGTADRKGRTRQSRYPIMGSPVPTFLAPNSLAPRTAAAHSVVCRLRIFARDRRAHGQMPCSTVTATAYSLEKIASGPPVAGVIPSGLFRKAIPPSAEVSSQGSSPSMPPSTVRKARLRTGNTYCLVSSLMHALIALTPAFDRCVQSAPTSSSFIAQRTALR